MHCSKRLITHILALTAILQGMCYTCANAQNSQVTKKPTLMYRPLVATKSSPMYLRYMAAGDKAHLRGDEQKSKAYYLAALDEVDKQKITTVGHIPSLSRRLVEMYPKDWKESKLSDEQKEKVQTEQVSVLQRVARLAHIIAPPGSISANMADGVDERLKSATAALAETKAALAEKRNNAKEEEQKSQVR